MFDFAAARLNMIESQVRPNKVTDPRIIAAMSELPREKFLPASLRGVAYVDEDIDLGRGRFLMEPMVEARLLQTARVKPTDVAMVIGAGSGYGAAVLAKLASTVIALESDAQLAAQATTTLAQLGRDNAVIVTGPLADGYPRQAPYDVIVFGGAVERIPPNIVEQLGEGGRLVAVVKPPRRPGNATLVARLGGIASSLVVFDAGTPLLPEFKLEPGFVF